MPGGHDLRIGYPVAVDNDFVDLACVQEPSVASSYIDQLNRANTFGKKLATTVEPLKAFYAAIDNLKRLFSAVYQATPVLVGSVAK